MFLFLLKKSFFDMWDNLLSVFLLNIGMIVLVCFMFLVPTLAAFSGGVLLFYLLFWLIIINFYMSAVYKITLSISDHEPGGLKDFFVSLVRSWKESLVSSLLMLVLTAIILYGLPYYFFSTSYLFIFFGIILLWVCVTLFVAGLYFFPVCFRLHKKMLRNIQTSFIFVLENAVFSGYVLLIFILLVPLSLLLLFLLPGPAGIILWINECFKIRLYKYHYLESNPGADRKKIPWQDLLREDNEKIGQRSIRGMIFPWKT